MIYQLQEQPLMLPQMQMHWLPTPWQGNGKRFQSFDHMDIALVTDNTEQGPGVRNKARPWVLPKPHALPERRG